jgi:hypothetical protein
MELSGQLVLNFKDQVAPMVKQYLLNFFALNLHNYSQLSESELLDATCFFCDFIEYANGQDTQMIAELNNKFIEIFNATDSMDVKQTLSYGMGVFAMYIDKQQYKSCIKNVMKCLTSMINAKDAFSEENVVATESALGALGKLIYFQKDNTNNITPDHIKLFLTHLPLNHESEEAQKSHLYFFQQVINNN